MHSLEAIYGELKNPLLYKKAVRKRIAKIILGSSVIRAFAAKTKTGLLDCLVHLEINSLSAIHTESEYDKWHYRKITSIYNCLVKTNKSKFKKHTEGLKWGHASKVFNLFIGHLYFYSPYYEKGKQKIKAHRFLHVPLDSKVFTVLKRYNIKTPLSIKTMTVGQYRDIQKVLRSAAWKKRVDPLLFDDYAWAMM